MHQVLANVSLSLVAGHVASGWHPLCFQAAKNPLHRRIIPAVSSAAHTLTHAITPQPLSKVAAAQYSSSDWRSFLKANNLVASMSRRGNCHDNAVAESFFQLLRRERIKRKIYSTREDARSDVFDYIEMFYNAKRRHGFNNQLSTVTGRV
jgi:transposase InsO family protein